MPKQRRKTTRTELWFDAEAIVQSNDHGVITGKVENLGSKGMFLETPERIPRNVEVEIKITFKSESPSELSDIKGLVVRHEDKGIGIQFIELDLKLFRECMTTMMED
jgi:hypothetical protein